MESVLEGVRRFQARRQENPELFERLAREGQSPQVLFIGCCDSRVPPEVITSVEPGEVFVARNIANIVPPYGTGEMSVGAVVEYAVLHLHVKRIMVCGHTDCAGIKALDNPVDWTHEPHIARWIEHARPAQTKVQAANLPADECHVAIVRENVVLQLEHLATYEPVRQAQRAGTLALAGWVYHLENGLVETYDPASGNWQPLIANQ
jgi:carbonic anhydrase